jgi:hypothetical protein
MQAWYQLDTKSSVNEKWLLSLSFLTSKARQAIYLWRNIETLSSNCHCRGKAISITYSEFVSLALVIQHATRLHDVILSPASCLALPYLSSLFHKRHDFRKNVIEYKMCVLILSTTFGWPFLILRRTERDMFKNMCWSSYELPVILPRF